MKMKYILTLMLLAIVTGTMAQKQLVILHTNDTHSTIFPLNVNLADTMKAGRGGVMRRVAMLEHEGKAEPELLRFDSGEFPQGAASYNMFKSDKEIEMMKLKDYAPVTIGNHE